MRIFEKSAFSGFSFLERIVETLETCENRIRSERLSRGMTLNELSDASGVSVSSLSRYERGCDVPSSALHRIADAMDTDSAVLLDHPDKMPRIAELELRLKHANAVIPKQEQIIRQKSVDARRKDVLIFVLVFIVLVALLSLLVDLCNPNIGWVRAFALASFVPV